MEGSTTLAPVEDPEVITRLKKVIAYVSAMVPNNAKGAVIVRRVAAEMLNEIGEMPPEFIEFYIKQLSTMMYWTATGETIDDMPLPEDFETVN